MESLKINRPIRNYLMAPNTHVDARFFLTMVYIHLKTVFHEVLQIHHHSHNHDHDSPPNFFSLPPDSSATCVLKVRAPVLSSHSRAG